MYINICDTKEKLEELALILAKHELLAYDVETNGLHFYKDVMIGFSLAINAKEGWYIPLLTWKPSGEAKTRSIDKVKYEVFKEGQFFDLWSNNTYPENVTQNEYKPPQIVKDFLQSIVDKKFIMHNAPFDINFTAYNFEIDLTEQLYCDTMLLHHCIDENSEQALKSVAEQWKSLLGYNPEENAKKEQEELGLSVIKNGGVWRPKTRHIWRGDLDVMARYCIKDTTLTYGVYKVGLIEFVKEYGEHMLPWFFEEEVMPLCKEVYIPMMRGGIHVDVEYFKNLKTVTEDVMNKFEDEAMAYLEPYLHDFPRKKAPDKRYAFNINSDANMRWIMIDKLKYDPKLLPQTESATKKKPIPSMKVEVLETHFMGMHPFIAPIVKYRKLNKIMSNYIIPAVELNNKGWVHMSIKQCGTVSGRPSCSGGLNLFTLPRKESISMCPKCESDNITTVNSMPLLLDLKCNDCGYEEKDIRDVSAIKKGFIAPEGYKIVEADFASAEPRVFSELSGDIGLKEVWSKNLDLYSKIYCDIFDKEGRYSANPQDSNYLKNLDPEKRQLMKVLALAVPYGSRANQVARLLDLKVKKVICDRETGEFKTIEMLDYDKGSYYRNAYLNTYPGLKKLMLKAEIDATTKGVVQTVVGRRRHLDYAKFIGQMLRQYRIDGETFLDYPHKKLEVEEVPELGLTKQGLFDFSKRFNNPMWNIKEKGNWAYVRALYRNEVNNSINCQVQGMVAHICSKAMITLARLLKVNNINAYISLTVYDSIAVYVEEGLEEDVKELMAHAMENNDYAKLISIPMKAEPKVMINLNGD